MTRDPHGCETLAELAAERAPTTFIARIDVLRERRRQWFDVGGPKAREMIAKLDREIAEMEAMEGGRNAAE